MAQLDGLVAERMPRLSTHMETNGALPVVYASPWMLTLFASEFPINFAGRLVDIMLAERSYAPVLRAALALLAEARGWGPFFRV